MAESSSTGQNSSDPMTLIARARSGETEALGQLCDLYRNYLRMLARTGLGPKLRERVELSDVVQETLIEVIRQFPAFTGNDEIALVGWLRRLIAQKLADLGRYHSRVKRGGGEAVWPLDANLATFGHIAGLAAEPGSRAANLAEILTLSQTSPSEAASRREATVLLADSLTKLPPDQAEVLWLYHVEGLSFESIGQRFGVSRKVVRGMWAKGLASLRKAMGPE
ncbi:MAG: sigma-70 family RNA polymerase sigma factor [bacterium]